MSMPNSKKSQGIDIFISICISISQRTIRHIKFPENRNISLIDKIYLEKDIYIRPFFSYNSLIHRILGRTTKYNYTIFFFFHKSIT